MFYDFDSPDTLIPEHADVCVIGAGAAGILLATQIAAAGRTVTLLEAGGLHQELRSQGVYRSEVTGHPHQGIHVGRFRYYGGTTTQWGGQILELGDSNFEQRSYVEGSGWPISKAPLTKYYEKALDFVGLKLAEREDSQVNTALNLEELNVAPEFSLLYSRHSLERNFAHHRAINDARGLSIYLHANVVGLVMKQGESVIKGVRVAGFSGRRGEIAADYFVICMGGIESTRLLLQPMAAGTAPWQANNLLGKHFQDHILVDCIPLRDVKVRQVHRYFGYEELGGYQYRTHVRLSSKAQAEYETLDIAGTINPYQKELRGSERASRMLRQIIREREPPLLENFASDAIHVPAVIKDLCVRRIFGEMSAWRRTMLTLHCEQSPNSASTISLSDRKDKFGMYITRLHWDISDLEIHSIRTYVRLAEKVFSRTQIAELRTPVGFFEDDALVRAMCEDSYHHMGGTRMSPSQSSGIVDASLKLHGVANGYICSTSVFPSSGFSNPTHTLLALAMRLSDHLIHLTLPETLPRRELRG
jgi:choline dehydrogenase-like flavoprotein